MKFRHEQKYLVDQQTGHKLYARLRPIMGRDKHDSGQGYIISSLYFDDIYDTAFKEKISGDFIREKFRFRIYNYSAKTIFLEKKMKIGGLCRKLRTAITLDQYNKIIEDKEINVLLGQDNLLNEFIMKKKLRILKPRQVVEYKRETFIYKHSNVRITFDQKLKAPISNDLFDRTAIKLPVFDNGQIIVEIKYDEFLPGFIAQAMQMDFGRNHACSKYQLCRTATHKIR